MNLDQELRSVLGQEAEQRTVPRPDLDGLIRGGRARRRRRTVARLGVAVTTAVLVGAVAIGVTQVENGDERTDPGIANQPSPSPSATDIPSFQSLDGNALDPRYYKMLAGRDSEGAPIPAYLAFSGPGWQAGNQPVVTDGQGWAGVGVYEALRVSGGNGCYGESDTRVGAATTEALARQLSNLPQATVLGSPVHVGGPYQSIHLSLLVDAHCPPGDAYRVAEGPMGSRGITFGNGPEPVVIDFWVHDVNGTLVVTDLWHHEDASEALVSQAAQAHATISFAPPARGPGASPTG